MIVLKELRNIFIWINIHPDTDSTTSKWKKYLRIFLAVAFPMNFFCYAIGSARYCYNHFDTNLDEALYALFPCIYAICLLYGLIVMNLHRREITETLAAFQEIYDQYENDESFKNQLTKTNQKCNKMTKMFILQLSLFQNIPTVCLAMMSVILSWMMYGTIVVDHLYVPYKYALPWDQSTFVGWIFDTIFCTISGTIYFLVISGLLTFFISICQHHLDFYQHFNIIVSRIDMKTKMCQNVKKEFRQLIGFHIKIQNLFRDTANIYSQFLLINLVCTMLHAALDLFLFDLAIQHNPNNIYICLFMFISALSILFLYCYYGSQSTDLYLTMADHLFESNWHELPLNLRKYVLLMIQSAQRPIYYHGFGIAYLNLKTFLKLCRTIVSYYLMFKTLTNESDNGN